MAKDMGILVEMKKVRKITIENERRKSIDKSLRKTGS